MILLAMSFVDEAQRFCIDNMNNLTFIHSKHMRTAGEIDAGEVLRTDSQSAIEVNSSVQTAAQLPPHVVVTEAIAPKLPRTRELAVLLVSKAGQSSSALASSVTDYICV
jgi:hypothetical protein